MRTEIQTGLPALSQPFSWAILSEKLLFNAHGPVNVDGNILNGGIGAQTRLTLNNLRDALAAAGGTLDDVLQVTVYILDVAECAAMDEVYRTYFSEPWPNRCTVVVAGLVAPGMRIELSAIARITSR